MWTSGSTEVILVSDRTGGAAGVVSSEEVLISGAGCVASEAASGVSVVAGETRGMAGKAVRATLEVVVHVARRTRVVRAH